MKRGWLKILLFLLVFTGAGLFWRNSLDKLSESRSALTAIIEPVKDAKELLLESSTTERGDVSETEIKKGEAGASSGPFTLPPGFRATLFSSVPGARVMVHAPEEMGGGLLVSATREGKIFHVRDTDGDGKADEVRIVAEGLKNPHGIAMRCQSAGEGRCVLYIAEEDALSSYRYDAGERKLVRGEKLVDLPSGNGHYTRTLLFMSSPDENILLVSVGSSCNVCRESDERRAKILAYDIETGEIKEFARGLRNTAFMAIHPVTGGIWGTEMGRDWLGDDLPPDEINIIREGKNYGWPNCYGQNVHDTEFDKNTYIRNSCMAPFETPSHIDIPAHSAPLGLAFFPEEGWSEKYWHDAIVALHGSWNRSSPAGYKIVRYPLDEKGNPDGEPEDFLTGFIPPNARASDAAIGRPVGILIEPGGVIYVSDDKAGAVYRITKN